ncbi:hypothetical protein [Acinetobacter vivianii]|uniref:hypothetical protein n=1 Tax=Acinetobacter vivianii TaxID=1776742 RepID=UPI003D008DD3
MNTQLIINEATYNAYKHVPVELRTAEIQDQIEAYEAQNSLNVDTEKDVSETSVEIPTATGVEANTKPQSDEKNGTEENLQLTEVFDKIDDELILEKVSSIEVNEKTAEMFASFHTQFERFSPKLVDDDLQNLIAISQLANGFSKRNAHHLIVTCSDLQTAEKLVKIRSYLDFDCVISDREDSYAIQGELAKAPYGTHGIFLDTSVQLSNTFKHHPDTKDIKYGSKFIACVGAKKYSHTTNEQVVAYVTEPLVFVEGNAPEKIEELNDKTDMGFMLHKVKRQQWRDAFGVTIKTAINSKELVELTTGLAPKFAQAWKPFLVIAKMISDEMFLSMYKLMMEYRKTLALGQEYKVYAAIRLALPDYEAYVTKLGFDSVVAVKTIEVWIKHYKQHVTSKKVSDALTEGEFKAVNNKFCMGINTSGFDLNELKTFIDSKLDVPQIQIQVQALLDEMKKALTLSVEAIDTKQQKVA